MTRPQVVTLIDITSFLRCLNVLPDLIMTDEVPPLPERELAREERES